MNVHTHQKNLEQLLRTGIRESKGKTKAVRPTYHSGVYILSRSLENQNFKLGMSFGTGGFLRGSFLNIKSVSQVKMNSSYDTWLSVPDRKLELNTLPT